MNEEDLTVIEPDDATYRAPPLASAPVPDPVALQPSKRTFVKVPEAVEILLLCLQFL